MRPDLPLSTVAIGGVPIATLCLLMLIGDLRAVPGFVAVFVVAAASLALAWLWTSDLDLLEDAVRNALQEDPQPRSAADARPVLPLVARFVRDVDRVSRTTAARAALVGQLRRADAAIVERLPDPVIVLGAERDVRRSNAAARTAFGADLLAVLRHPGLRAAIDRAFAQGTRQAAELVLPVPVERELHATVIFIDPPLSDGGQAIVVLSDRTRERAVERMRADFVANASHELRTPLASLIGFIDTLRGPAADDRPAQQRFLGIMAEQAARMNRLIDDLLSLSRIELTEHQLPAERVDLPLLIQRMVAGFEPRLTPRQQRIEVEIAPELPMVTGDPDQLAQVLQNLLDNAVKYGREGAPVRVTAALTTAETADGSIAGRRWPARPGVLLSVVDRGQGIARVHLPRLTERFYRADTGRSRVVGGTGLGLAIVKHVVNRHRGQMLIESEEGVGTTVFVWLPQTPAGGGTEPGGLTRSASVGLSSAPPGSD